MYVLAVFIVFSHLSQSISFQYTLASFQADATSQLPQPAESSAPIDKSAAETLTGWDGYDAGDAEEDVEQEWSEEEWKLWNEWDGEEEFAKEEPEEEEIPDPERHGVATVGEHQGEEEYVEVDVSKPPEPDGPPPKRAKPERDDHETYSQWDDQGWDGPWNWAGWNWKESQQKWSPRAWQGKSSSARSHSQKAPWAYSKGKGKTKHKGKSKQDRWGGSYVRGGYMDPDGHFYKHLDDFIGISLDF